MKAGRTRRRSKPERECAPRTRRRAIYDDEKEARREAILAQARRQFAADPSSLPTVAAVAADMGLAKATLYLYFQTKEEIFVALLQQELERSHAVISAAFDRARHVKSDRAALEIVLEGWLRYPLDNTVLLDLASLSVPVLEPNLRLEAGRQLKYAMAEAVDDLAQRVHERFGLPLEVASNLILDSYALLVGIYQNSRLPAGLDALRHEQRLQRLLTPFEQRVRTATYALWKGTLDSD